MWSKKILYPEIDIVYVIGRLSLTQYGLYATYLSVRLAVKVYA